MPIASAGCGMAWQWIHRILCPMLYTIQYRDKYLHQRQQRKLKGGRALPTIVLSAQVPTNLSVSHLNTNLL